MADCTAHRTLCVALLLATAGCAGPGLRIPDPPAPAPVRPGDPGYVDAGDRITPEPEPDSVPDIMTAPVVLAVAEGEATYYASKFDGRRTASGVVFRNSEAWAAHRTFPFGTMVRVTNLRNGRSVIVRVVDRGPFGNANRIIDVSQSAARELDFMSRGVTPVRVEVLEWGPGK